MPPSYVLKPYIGDTVQTAHFHQGDYYFIGGDYGGTYDIQFRKAPNGELSGLGGENIFSYDDYCAFCKKWNITQTFSDSSQHYLVYAFHLDDASELEARLAAVEYENDTATLYYWNTESFLGPGDGSRGYAIIVPTEKQVMQLKTELVFSLKVYEQLAAAEKEYIETGVEPEPE